MSIDKPKQSLITAEETGQVSFTSKIEELKQSEVSLEIEESCTLTITNEETKKIPTKK